MRLPDPARSYAVLVGASAYRSDGLADIPAVRHNVDGLAAVLTDPALGVLTPERCRTVRDPVEVRSLWRTMRQGAAVAEDLLLVYFAGHGLIGPRRNDLYLALADTEPDELPVSALPFDRVRELFLDSPASKRVLILDCCFSGRAIPDMGHAEEAGLGQVDIHGTYILTSTHANAVALAPVGARYTAFTGELLSLLHTGIPDGPELLTASTIYRHLHRRMRTQGFPEPRQIGTDFADLIALARNPEYRVASRVVMVDPVPTASPSSDRPADIHELDWAARTREIRSLTGHSATVYSVAFSPDGTLLATGSSDETVRLWDVATGRTTDILKGHTHEVYPVAFSPDGATLASGGRDITVRLWDVARGRTTDIFKGHNHTLGAVKFSPDGTVLATGGDVVRLWQVATGHCDLLKGHTKPIWALAFTPDGRLLATGSDDETVCLWDMATRRALDVLKGHTHGVTSLAFSPDGTTLASGSSDETVRLWDLVTGRTTDVLKGHTSWVRSVAFHPDGKVLASASDDATVRLWDVTTGRALDILQGHTDHVHGVAFSPDGANLATASADTTARLWALPPPLHRPHPSK